MPSLTWERIGNPEGEVHFGVFEETTYTMILVCNFRDGAFYQFKGLKTADLDGDENEGMKGADTLDIAKQICNVMLSAWITAH